MYKQTFKNPLLALAVTGGVLSGAAHAQSSIGGDATIDVNALNLACSASGNVDLSVVANDVVAIAKGSSTPP